ncbi:autophagy-related protein 2 homolog B-like isoform X2 [Paramacrobiotus metropolitanus]|uniref:autophagy-related protein 2 homolog B-like isoform X2 n=1 Tax=Paramacrobiotus metropolitanus TaxID=2943436 RepID=UPI002445670B|nr:autophagy-related protein 2 homolog B-like isoform X2 [Paramacrobiotus metropolitanus]
MPWNFPWLESVKKRACRYLLQRYLGQFLKEKVDLDQLSVSLFNGTGVVNGLVLDSELINESFESVNLPFEIVDGYIGCVSVDIPWSALLSDNTRVEIKGLEITLRPKRVFEKSVMLDSMWGSMTKSSMQLAEECLREDERARKAQANQLEGLEKFAQAIDIVLTRIKVNFSDIVVRLEQEQDGFKTRAIALEVRIKNVKYFDQAATESKDDDETVNYQPAAVAKKCFIVEGVDLFSDEYTYPFGTTESTSMFPSSHEILENSEMFYSARDLGTVTRQPDMEQQNQTPKQTSQNLVQIAACHEMIDIQLEVKQTDGVNVPKFKMSGHVGVIHAIVWPKQLEMLKNLFRDMFPGSIEDHGRNRLELQKPMTTSDYSKIESELQRDIDARQHLTQGGNNIELATWNTDRTLREDEEFFSFDSRRLSNDDGIHRRQPGKSVTVDSSFSERQLTTINAANIRIRALILTVVQEDPEGARSCPSFPFSELQKTARDYFSATSDVCNWDFQDTLLLRHRFSRTIPHGHLWISASTLLIECSEKRSTSAIVQSLKCSFGGFEAWEHLFKSDDVEPERHQENLYHLKTVPLCTEILSFPNRNSEDRYSFTSCITIELESTEKVGGATSKTSSQKNSELKIALQPAKTDLDITIIDRLVELFAALSLPDSGHDLPENPWSAGHPVRRVKSDGLQMNVSLSCVELTVHIRFPVLDLRPARDRFPTWKRALHKEKLIVIFSELAFTTALGDELVTKLDFNCRSLSAGFQSSANEKPIMFLEAEMDVDYSIDEKRRNEFANRLKLGIILRKFPRNVVSADILVDHDYDGNAKAGSLEDICETTEKEPSLFMTSKNIVEHEEINCVQPARSEQASAFKDHVLLNSEMSIEIVVPKITAFIPDKNVLEILYNRINTDLLLWEPAGPASGQQVIPLSAAHLMGRNSLDNGPVMFEMCKSAADSDTGSDIDDEENWDHAQRINKLKASGLSKYRAQIPSEVCVVLNIGNASVGAKIGKHGERRAHEAWVEISRGSIFSVSGYRGQPEIRYSSVKVQRLELYFGDFVAPDVPVASLKRPAHLLPVIEPLDDELLLDYGSPDTQLDDACMLNVAVDIHVDTFRNIKDIKVALELNALRMHYRVTLPDDFWLTQFIEYLNLRDFPVMGYNSPTIITEFHLSIGSSAAEYRPKYMPSPLAALVAVNKLNLSSTLVAESPQTLLRVIAQDLRLHLSKRKQPAKLKEGKTFLRNIIKNCLFLSTCFTDYVCVLDIPFMEFQVKIAEGSPDFPRFDFRASNDCCYLRTCSDSCLELCNLLKYLAEYRDLNIAPAAPKIDAFPRTVSLEAKYSQDENVFDEMMDAMKESPPRRDSLAKHDYPMHTPLHVANNAHFPMAATISSSLKTSMSDANPIDDDDFCIIDEDLGVGIAPKSGEPGVKLLTMEPIRIVENHFAVPLAVTDQLKAPDGYPLPIVRVTLKEMSFVWCLYGGKDFDDKVVYPRRLSSHNRLHSAPGKTRSSSRSDKTDAGHSPSWLLKGGAGRDHSVLMEIHLNKVKFQHEQYPFDGKTVKAARQVLFIQDFEIRDRLASSEINKFLYQYVAASMPKQSYASMFSIRALHERPDPALPMQECTLKISLQPLRLNIDQESMFFLGDFFAALSDTGAVPPKTITDEEDFSERSSPHSAVSQSPKDQIPIRTTRLGSLEEEEMFAQDPLIRFDDAPKKAAADAKLDDLLAIPPPILADPDSEIFFKSITFSPDVPIMLDYHGKHVDVERVGALGGLLIGLAQLNCTMLRLKALHNRQGIRGLDRMLLALLNDWLDDVRKTQLANLLAGVGPMHCFVQLVQGIRDLFWLPVEQYRKDGRIVRGVQRGASAFTTSTLIAALELTNRIIQTVQVAAESAYDVISPGPSFKRKRRKSNVIYPKSQPGDLREGVVTAYRVLREGFTDTAQEIVDAVSEEREHKGMTGAVGGALRQIPPAIVKPLILASQATSNVLGGLRNQLQPDIRQDELEKWRTDDDVRSAPKSRSSDR